MKISVAAVKRLCQDADLPAELVERNIDAMCFLVMRVAQWQRKKDVSRIRGWWFDKSPNKTPLFEVLLEESEEDILE